MVTLLYFEWAHRAKQLHLTALQFCIPDGSYNRYGHVFHDSICIVTIRKWLSTISDRPTLSSFWHNKKIEIHHISTPPPPPKKKTHQNDVIKDKIPLIKCPDTLADRSIISSNLEPISNLKTGLSAWDRDSKCPNTKNMAENGLQNGANHNRH